MMVGMEVRLLYFEDCPNWQLAKQRLYEALATVGKASVEVTYELVTTPEHAERVGFRGSPTILIDGRDPFARPEDPVGLSCRLYRSADGTEHAPSVNQLAAVLADAH